MTFGVWHHRRLREVQSGPLSKVVGDAPTFLSVPERRVPTCALSVRAKAQKRTFGMAWAVLEGITSVTHSEIIQWIATTKTANRNFLMITFLPFVIPG